MIVSLLESSASGRLLGSVVRGKKPTEGESDHVTSPCQKRGRKQSKERCEQGGKNLRNSQIRRWERGKKDKLAARGKWLV